MFSDPEVDAKKEDPEADSGIQCWKLVPEFKEMKEILKESKCRKR